MADRDTLYRMRTEWNQRAVEDAHYYVAFGRRSQDDAEFFATGADAVRALEAELPRLAGRGRALEIGCGPGRLMRPLAAQFGEIHGVDVSEEMVRLAREKLSGVTNAYPHHNPSSDLALFPDEHFDFVYSYAVFQHIPSRMVVLHYLQEARRTLKTGGVLRCQMNGLPEEAGQYDTWHGVRVSPGEVGAFAGEQDMQLLALEGAATQYMWVTMRKQPAGWTARLAWPASGAAPRIRNVSNADTGEPVVPAAGPLAAIAVWVENLPPDCDLNHLEVEVDGWPARPTYIGPRQWDGVTQLNAVLSAPAHTGLAPVEVRWLGRALGAPAWARIIPPGPAVPRVCGLTDGVDLMSGRRIVSRLVKVTLEELRAPEQFAAQVDEVAVGQAELFCVDPAVGRFEINFALPDAIGAGPHEVRMRVGKRSLGAVPIEVV